MKSCKPAKLLRFSMFHARRQLFTVKSCPRSCPGLNIAGATRRATPFKKIEQEQKESTEEASLRPSVFS
jgi:hypothetical protein